jgi:D-3-phosphoglycerate dehydrogenase
MTHIALVTDHAWPTLSVEREVLAGVDAELLVARRDDEEELVELAPSAEAILTNWRRIPPAALDAASRCLVVSRYGIGVDNIPVEHATRLGIIVTNVPEFCVDEVSDHTLALVLACGRRIARFDHATSAGRWDLQAVAPGMRRMRGQRLGLVGYGTLGRAVAVKAVAFGLQVLAYTPRLARTELGPGVAGTNDLKALLETADYVSLHAPATPETRGIINQQALRTMKPTAYLVNTARGALVDEDALFLALTEGWIAGAALDVLAVEPAPSSHPLLGLDNVIVTPHAAFYSEEAIADVQRQAASHVAQALRGEMPSNVVNPAVVSEPTFRLGRHLER